MKISSAGKEALLGAVRVALKLDSSVELVDLVEHAARAADKAQWFDNLESLVMEEGHTPCHGEVHDKVVAALGIVIQHRGYFAVLQNIATAISVSHDDLMGLDKEVERFVKASEEMQNRFVRPTAAERFMSIMERESFSPGEAMSAVRDYVIACSRGDSHSHWRFYGRANVENFVKRAGELAALLKMFERTT